MIADKIKSAGYGRFSFQNAPRRVLAPLPLPLLQPLLRRAILKATQARPEIFARLGPQAGKRFLIDPVNLPFVFLLEPDPQNPRLRAFRRWQSTSHDARIAGTFLTLLEMIDGRLDGDALFFTRDLIVEGDTEAVVVLRNALDDLDGSIIDDIAQTFGFPARAGLRILRKIKRKKYDASPKTEYDAA